MPFAVKLHATNLDSVDCDQAFVGRGPVDAVPKPAISILFCVYRLSRRAQEKGAVSCNANLVQVLSSLFLRRGCQIWLLCLKFVAHLHVRDVTVGDAKVAIGGREVTPAYKVL